MLRFFTDWLIRLVPEGYEDSEGFHYGKPPHHITDSARFLPTSARSRVGVNSLGAGPGHFCGDDIRPASLISSSHIERGNL